MTIKGLIEKLAGDAVIALPDYEVFMGTKSYFEQVNLSVPLKIIVIEPPKQWDANYFTHCQRDQTVPIYLGYRVDINEISRSLSEYNTYIFDSMVVDLKLFLAQVDSNVSYFVKEEPILTLFNPEDGETVNSYAYIKFDLRLTING